MFRLELAIGSVAVCIVGVVPLNGQTSPHRLILDREGATLSVPPRPAAEDGLELEILTVTADEAQRYQVRYRYLTEVDQPFLLGDDDPEAPAIPREESRGTQTLRLSIPGSSQDAAFDFTADVASSAAVSSAAVRPLFGIPITLQGGELNADVFVGLESAYRDTVLPFNRHSSTPRSTTCSTRSPPVSCRCRRRQRIQTYASTTGGASTREVAAEAAHHRCLVGLTLIFDYDMTLQ